MTKQCENIIKCAGKFGKIPAVEKRETQKSDLRNLLVINFVISCNFPLDELEIPVYNTATKRKHPEPTTIGWGLSPNRWCVPANLFHIFLGGKHYEDS